MFEDFYASVTGAWTNATTTVSGLLTSGKEKVSSLWTPAAPANTPAVVGARRRNKTPRRKSKQRRRTGRRSNGHRASSYI